MTRVKSSFSIWLFVLLVGIALQITFTLLDLRSSPSKTVIQFSKAYFLFDDVSMRDCLCSNLCNNEYSIDEVLNNYLFRKSEEASDLGLELKATRRSLIHAKAQIINQNYDFAQVRIMAVSKKYINPLFAWVAQIFHLGKLYDVDEVLELVKEGSKWKISGQPFNLCSKI